MGKFFDSLKAGLKEAIEHDLGKKTLKTRNLELPNPPATYPPEEVKRTEPVQVLQRSLG